MLNVACTGSILVAVSSSSLGFSTNHILEKNSRIVCWERCSKGSVGPILAWVPTLLSQVCTAALHFIAPNLLSITVGFSKHSFASVGVHVLFYIFMLLLLFALYCTEQSIFWSRVTPFSVPELIFSTLFENPFRENSFISPHSTVSPGGNKPMCVFYHTCVEKTQHLPVWVFPHMFGFFHTYVQ